MRQIKRLCASLACIAAALAIAATIRCSSYASLLIWKYFFNRVKIILAKIFVSHFLKMNHAKPKHIILMKHYEVSAEYDPPLDVDYPDIIIDSLDVFRVQMSCMFV